ncbi:MAG: hypothetical protein E4H23_03825 [Chrysiogenales bacterium]|nr:MAG: hypothetical protein E4H23_03825 [Chrysiogenales bacterium]
MKKFALMIILLVAVLASVQAAQSRETLSLDASGCKSMHIDCGAGYLKVKGEDKLEQIEVKAILHVKGIAASELPAFKKEYVTLKLDKVGGKATLTAEIESGFSLATLFESHDARIDLEIRLPRRLALAVEDGSGDSEIRFIDGDLQFKDGSGDILLEEIGGAVEIDDGSGEMFLTAIKGNVNIDDGSGEIELKEVGGDVVVDDGSGEIRIFHVQGSVEIDDGSGDIIIDGVEKDVTIKEAGSGDVQIRNVKGKVRK